MINLLNEAGVEKTNNSKKISYRGELKSLPIYRVPISLLLYNIQNDRIATWISKHESNYGKINVDDQTEFNNTLQKYIINSNEQAYSKTKKNIKLLGQREPGIILKNGIIIDGNRRFTCLRDLYNETNDNNFYYFETVILDVESTPRDIKLLELEIQHGQDEKVDYNPIEKLVGIYNDVVKNKILTAQEYANSIAITLSEMNKLVEQAEMMEDFLEYINSPEKFYIAREMDLDGPLIELQRIKKQTPNEDEWEIRKILFYDNILVRPKGDMTRMIRNMWEIMKSENTDNYIEKHFELSEKIHDKLKQTETIDTDFIRKNIRADEELKESMRENFEINNEKSKKNIIKKLPVSMLESINENIDKIDIVSIQNLDSNDKENFIYLLDSLKYKIKNIEEKLDE